VTGRIRAVQESRFRLLAEDGRWLLFLLHHGAPVEPQDLPALRGRRLRVTYEDTPVLTAAAIARDLLLLPEAREALRP
jgi:hypothetical protein